jgi:hypothetical protein
VERRKFLYQTGFGLTGIALLPVSLHSLSTVTNELGLILRFLQKINAVSQVSNANLLLNSELSFRCNQLKSLGFRDHDSFDYVTADFLLKPMVLKANGRLVDFVVLIMHKKECAYRYSGTLSSGHVTMAVEFGDQMVSSVGEGYTLADVFLPVEAARHISHGTSSFKTKHGLFHLCEKIDNGQRHNTAWMETDGHLIWKVAGLSGPLRFCS